MPYTTTTTSIATAATAATAATIHSSPQGSNLGFCQSTPRLSYTPCLQRHTLLHPVLPGLRSPFLLVTAEGGDSTKEE
ncbi:hypothetical protein HOO65_040380 [Ceratocystis lukuohia]|uniref:Secreted protein n=1 Tax=Ceratocystis lukuohia TaxID=2019550 RepID=A0ABR4MIE0_9PEZI